MARIFDCDGAHSGPPRRAAPALVAVFGCLIAAAYVAAYCCCRFMPVLSLSCVATVQIATDLSFATAARLAILAQAVLHGHVEKNNIRKNFVEAKNWFSNPK
ncbi:hypothetical protein ACTJLB_04700 [Paraburkholderia sp. 22098]|uniref:hypothetical protein n=1 Tax=Paraburkholderia sp. 22098 TaxID=3453874 RepID=UPI003F8802E8